METSSTHSSWKQGLWISFGAFAFSLLYAFLRYNVIRDVALIHLPLYIGNKAVAMASVIIIGLSFVLGPLAHFWPRTFVNHLHLRKPLGVVGFGMAALHALMSLVLLTPAYYEKFFSSSGKMNLVGEFSMLFGALGFLVFTAVAVSSLPEVAQRVGPKNWQTIQRLGYLAYIFVLLHVVIMGFKGWFDPTSFQYGFASITLVSSLVIVFVLILRLLTLAAGSGQPPQR